MISLLLVRTTRNIGCAAAQMMGEETAISSKISKDSFFESLNLFKDSQSIQVAEYTQLFFWDCSDLLALADEVDRVEVPAFCDCSQPLLALS
jgi:hypothetical protein